MRSTLLLAMCAGALSAETWTGTVVDVMCKGRDLASHTRECALQCAKGGFGLVLGDGTFVKFNESGNARTLAQLKKLDREKDLKAKVSGERKGEVIAVQSIEFQ
ncbi:MAG: hypothetical protein FJW38_03610 [Acidobacteria bacterium]|nr:hypothetical protein [Acidobacteriota bacterium]